MVIRGVVFCKQLADESWLLEVLAEDVPGARRIVDFPSASHLPCLATIFNSRSVTSGADAVPPDRQGVTQAAGAPLPACLRFTVFSVSASAAGRFPTSGRFLRASGRRLR